MSTPKRTKKGAGTITVPFGALGEVWMEEAAGEGIFGAEGEGTAEEATTDEVGGEADPGEGGSCVRARFLASTSSGAWDDDSSNGRFLALCATSMDAGAVNEKEEWDTLNGGDGGSMLEPHLERL